MTKDLLSSEAFKEELARLGIDPNSISENDIKKVFNENKELSNALNKLHQCKLFCSAIYVTVPGQDNLFQVSPVGEIFVAVGEGMTKINEYAAENPKEALLIQAGLITMSLAAGGPIKGTLTTAAKGVGYGVVIDQIADFIAPPVSARQTNRNLEEFNIEVEQGEEKQNNLLLGVSTSVAFVLGSVSLKKIKDIASFKKKVVGKNNSSAGKTDSKADKTGTNETDGPNNNNKSKADNDNKNNNNNNTKAKVDTPDDIISNSTPDKISTGRESTIYYRNGGGGFDQVNADFDSMNLKNVRELNYPDGSKGRMGTLPDGRNVLTRPASSGKRGELGPPTLEIHSKRPNGKVRITKVRY